MTIDELRERRDRLATELADLQARTETPGIRTRIRDTDRALARADSELADAELRMQRVRELAGNPRNCEPAEGPLPYEKRKSMSTTRTDNSPGAEARSAAMRALDRAYENSQIGDAAGTRLHDLIDRDKLGVDARYIEAVADPAYERAFGKKITATSGAAVALTPEEGEAMDAVGRAMAERSMITGEGSAGGFALPFELDPSIQLESDGELNPIRSLATVTSVTTVEWRGITSEGVTAEFAKEGDEVKDNSPELAQPKIRPERAHSFVPFSIEYGQDWPSLSQELFRLFSDARDTLEATKFTDGTGEDEPEGLLTGASKTVATATKDVLAVGDVYANQEALPPRFQPRASWLSSLTIANTIHRFSSPGGEEAPLFNEDRTRLLGKPWAEASTLPTTTKGNDLPLVYGDLKAGYRIVDRIGMTVELVPHLMGENGRPKGERGLYCIWRVGAAVQIANAIRVLKVKNS
jgi:HK97 family phage major capsid protein